MSPTKRRTSFAAAAAVALTLPACATVKQDQLEAAMASMRAEMEVHHDSIAIALADLEARHDSVQDRLDRITTELSTVSDRIDGTVARLETAVRFSAPIHFGFDSAELGASDKSALDEFANVVAEFFPAARVTVEGFTDASGSAAYNKKLGERRAEAVRHYLVGEAGLTSASVRTVSYGEDADRLVVPEAYGPGEDGSVNRRVVLVIDAVDTNRGVITP